jgi:AraC-like DNA-binding protein
MADPRATYCNYRPLKGHPLCWVFKAQPFELAYLSWGNRWYGDAPANPKPHDGWHYFVVLDGAPLLVVNGREIPSPRGTASIAHPDCVVGHRDRPGRRCQMLTWVWRAEPTLPSLSPPAGDFLTFTLEPAVLRRLKKLSEQCRAAVARADDRSLLELRAARLQMELCLLEGHERRGAADGDFRINLAAEFLRNHLDEPEPVRKLCEYLHISEASLKRLFHEHTGKSPRAFAAEWRMQWAREQLGRTGATVKGVAYALGYRHANDFSRAFKRHHGEAASGLLNRRLHCAAK